jgi:hypothetical protein
MQAPSGRNRFHCRRNQNGWATPNRFGPLLDGRMAGRRSGRNGCFGAAAAGVLHGARTIPTVAGRSMRALSRLADVTGFWTLDRTTITGRSGVILRQHTTPFRPMIVPLMIWSLSSKLEKLEPPHTHKFPRVNAQHSKLGPIQPWDVKDFLRPGRPNEYAWAASSATESGVSGSPTLVRAVGDALGGTQMPKARVKLFRPLTIQALSYKNKGEEV